MIVELSSPGNHYTATTYHILQLASVEHLHVEVYDTRCGFVASYNQHQYTKVLHSYRH